MNEAMERARRHGALSLAGGHVSAPLNHVPHSVLDRTPAKPIAVRNRLNDKRSRDRGSPKMRSNGRSPSSNRAEMCTHPSCRSKQCHSTKSWWTRAREERLFREAASGAAEASAAAAST